MKKNHLFKLDIKKLNFISILILIVTFIITWIIFPDDFYNIMALVENDKIFLLLFPLMFFYAILHELFHAAGYIINGADYKKITFGIELEKSVLYCLCKTNVSKRNILFSLMYPLFFIGVVTYVLGIIFNLPLLTLLSIFNISGAAGDIMYFLFILKLDKNIEYSEMDDGTSFVIISKNKVDKFKHYGLIYAGEIEEIPRNDFKRVKITKISWIIIAIATVVLAVGLFM